MRFESVGAAVAVACCLVASASLAEEWPTRSVKVIVPYGAGGVTDTMARVTTDGLARKLGQPFVIENRPGAGGLLGTEAALRAPRDGYTVLFASGVQVTVAPLVHKTNFDLTKELVPVSITGENIMGFAVNPKSDIKTIAQLIDHVRANPGKFNYAIAGMGTNSHLTGAAFGKRADLEMVAIPFTTAPASIAAVIAGQVDAYFGNLSDSVPFVASGQVRLLAVSSEHRKPELPDVPTVAETVPGFTVVSWNGYYAPAGMPDDAIKRLETAAVDVCKEPDVARKLGNLGVDAACSTAAQMKAALIRDLPLAALAVDAAGLRRKE